jgi:hypothetical protein
MLLFMRIISLFMARSSFQNTRMFSNPKCKDCIYYETREHPFTNCLSKCRRFGDRDSETGRISYEYADLCRKSEQKCGETGKYFEPTKK